MAQLHLNLEKAIFKILKLNTMIVRKIGKK